MSFMKGVRTLVRVPEMHILRDMLRGGCGGGRVSEGAG